MSTEDLNKVLLKGIEEAENGETKDLGSFSQYLEEDDDEDR